jgi:hypothetical protein
MVRPGPRDHEKLRAGALRFFVLGLHAIGRNGGSGGAREARVAGEGRTAHLLKEAFFIARAARWAHRARLAAHRKAALATVVRRARRRRRGFTIPEPITHVGLGRRAVGLIEGEDAETWIAGLAAHQRLRRQSVGLAGLAIHGWRAQPESIAEESATRIHRIAIGTIAHAARCSTRLSLAIAARRRSGHAGAPLVAEAEERRTRLARRAVLLDAARRATSHTGTGALRSTAGGAVPSWSHPRGNVRGPALATQVPSERDPGRAAGQDDRAARQKRDHSGEELHGGRGGCAASAAREATRSD